MDWYWPVNTHLFMDGNSRLPCYIIQKALLDHFCGCADTFTYCCLRGRFSCQLWLPDRRRERGKLCYLLNQW